VAADHPEEREWRHLDSRQGKTCMPARCAPTRLPGMV